ncbi:MAG TPA: 30S ribosomal protein S6 [Fibrobacteria bacterium]|jgi:small subunit ribosomal protein S6|nr:30S ribosomal protein S6 [Fibrobacteria bacterium]
MKRYETILVVDAMIPDESIASEFDAVAKLIESQGKITRVDRWGKRRLAYPIRKRTHGEYAAFYYDAEPGLPAELEKRLRINENALRWLTVAENPAGIPPAPVADGAPEADEKGEKGDKGEEKAKKEGDE